MKSISRRSFLNESLKSAALGIVGFEMLADFGGMAIQDD
jgi:hypothetical protein